MVRELRSVFSNRVFNTLIHDDEALARAPAVRKAVIEFDPESQASKDYRQLAEEVCSAGGG